MNDTLNRGNGGQQNNAGGPGPKKNNNKKRYFGKKPNQAGPNNSGNQNSGNSTHNNKKKNFFKRKTTTVKQSGIDYITTKYLNLLDQHIQARRKYFENFDRVNGATLDKLEQNFIESQKLFLTFKEKLNDEDRKNFEARYESIKPDTIYSSNHDLNDESYKVPEEQLVIEDPHLLESQKKSNFSDDTEESMGSIEDYKSYKNI